MKRIAAPMVGGILTSFFLELLVYPAIYDIWRTRSGLRRSADSERRTHDAQNDLQLALR
jgi:copper/silver efflux system protein